MIVCGWYTPDYGFWAERLIASLDERDIPHDIVGVGSMNGRWETKTLAKPIHILAAMDRHPDKVIVFLDVDCVVKGDLHAEVSDFNADIGIFWYANMRNPGKNPPYRFRVSSATMLFSPTSDARAFVEAWDRANGQMGFGDVDQTSFVIAMGDPGHNATFKNIGQLMCVASRYDVHSPFIIHSFGTENHQQLSSLGRRFGAILRLTQ